VAQLCCRRFDSAGPHPPPHRPHHHASTHPHHDTNSHPTPNHITLILILILVIDLVLDLGLVCLRSQEEFVYPSLCLFGCLFPLCAPILFCHIYTPHTTLSVYVCNCLSVCLRNCLFNLYSSLRSHLLFLSTIQNSPPPLPPHNFYFTLSHNPIFRLSKTPFFGRNAFYPFYCDYLYCFKKKLCKYPIFLVMSALYLFLSPQVSTERSRFHLKFRQSNCLRRSLSRS
jgi:hypothetical protein